MTRRPIAAWRTCTTPMATASRQAGSSRSSSIMSEITTVSVIGIGYIGLPTCAIFASRGLNVIGIDVNESVVEKVNRGEILIVEPDLDGLIQKVVANGKLKAFTTPQPAEAIIIPVQTPK